jgi:CRP/FNR family transcriptional regulator, cyclic AMP receptor protein
VSNIWTNIHTVTDYAPPAVQRRLLAKVDVLEGLTPEEVERLALLTASVHLGAGETFTLAEDRRTLLLLVSGQVRVHELNAAGPGLTISMVEDRTVVAQTGFATRRSRALRVEALEPSVVRVLEWEAFEDLVHRNPEVGVKTIRLLSERLAVYEGRLADLIRKEVVARLASLILSLSEHEGVVMSDGSRRIPTRYTHNQLASMVGSNREAVTRAFRKLREAGAVEIKDRHIYVTDVDALNRVAEIGR